MLTGILKGYFDTKVYNEKKTRDQWKTKGEDETISFTCSFEDSKLPQMFVDYGKPYTSKNGDNMVRVTFKIGSRCRWFNEQGQSTDKPLNETLDGKYEVNIDFVTLHGKEGTKEARGYWVNAIQFKKCEAFQFAPMGVGQTVVGIVEEEPQASEEQDLPF